MKTLLAAAGLGLTLLTAPAFADANHANVPRAQATDAGDRNMMAEGVVRKVAKARGRITIKHGPLANLDMPPMTMVFRVKDDAMLDGVKPGDKILFKAEDIGGALTVTELAPAQ
ncbi:MAG: copper-binding protein [Rhodocyclaceae bacterium]|nr:copper-binding protein [Rhodocyclaceae bacterium]